MLEIGSGSGLILWEMAARVARVRRPRSLGAHPGAQPRAGRAGGVDQRRAAHRLRPRDRGAAAGLVRPGDPRQHGRSSSPARVYLERVVELALVAPRARRRAGGRRRARRRGAGRSSGARWPSSAAHPGSAAARPPAGRRGAGALPGRGLLPTGLPGRRVPPPRARASPTSCASATTWCCTRGEARGRRPRAQAGVDRLARRPAAPAAGCPPASPGRRRLRHPHLGLDRRAQGDRGPAPAGGQPRSTGSTATFGVGPGDRVLFVTSLGFDLSVYDIFGAAGGGRPRSTWPPRRSSRDPDRAGAPAAREEPITVWDSAPAALQQLAPLFPGRRTAASRAAPGDALGRLDPGDAAGPACGPPSPAPG